MSAGLSTLLTRIGRAPERTPPPQPGRIALRLVLAASLAAIAAGAVERGRRRCRLLAERLAWRARQEYEFTKIAQRLMAASDSAEVAACIASGILRLGPIRGVYIELLLPGGHEVEIAARAGEGTPEAGDRRPYRGSFTEVIAEGTDPVVHLTDDGPVIIASLPGDDGPLGALILALDPTGASRHPPVDTRVKIVADLASLALKRVKLIDEAQARRSEIERHLESKARLIRGFTHDLKNPIGAIDGYAEVLEAGIKGELSPAHREYVARIRAATRSMLDLIDDLVELARVEAGELRLEPREVDPAELIGAISDQYRANAAARGLRLETSVPPTLPTFRTDPDRVRQILGNLISNAIKYTPPPGRVSMKVETRSPDTSPGRGEWLAISISDTGPGIDPAAQASIFEEFARFSPENNHGAGLGLAISRHIARAMQGEITVESHPGEGSTFILWLPLS